MLGKYLSLALMLPSGAFAGFLLGRFAEHWIHASWPTVVGIVLGVIASMVKVFDELNRDLRREERERLNASKPPPGRDGHAT
jgi:F0F1-type ATP synthase assembly protein I